MHRSQRVKTGGYVIQYNPTAFRKRFQLSHRRRLDDIEGTKKYKAREKRFPCERHGDQITTNCGSFVPEPRATRVAAGIPTSVTTAAKAMATGVRQDAASAWASAAHNNTVAADAQLPGPGRSPPIPKNVAISVAHGGVRRDAPATSALASVDAGSEGSFTDLRPERRPDPRECSLGSARPHP